MNLLLNDAIDTEQWRKLLESSPHASPFQTPEYYDFFNSMFGFSANVFAVVHNEKIKALVCVTLQKEKGIKGYFSRRAIIFGGPVFFENSNKELSFLLLEIAKYYRTKAIYLEIRNFFDYSAHKTVFEQAGFNYVPWLNFHLETDSLENVKMNMSSSRMRQIKKAIKAGAFWREAESEKEIKDFYEILLDLYQNKIKKPLPAFEFFQKFYSKKAGKYLLVYFDEKLIGGIMCPVLQNKAIYEFYVCGFDREYKDQYPSVMATWAAIEYALQNYLPLFDFMGAGSPNESYGVREFKARFGGKQVEHGRFIKVLNPALYSIGKMGLNMLSKIK